LNEESQQRLTIPENLPSGLVGFCIRFARLVGLGMVSGNVMHDIRNSLAVVSGHAQIIQLKADKITGEDVAKRMDQVIDQVDKILAIINQVGSYTARAQGEKTEVEPKKALINAVHAMQRRFENVGLSITLEQSQEAKNIWCDGSLFDFALLQLLEACVPAEHIEGQVTVSAAAGDSWWETELRVRCKADNDRLRAFFSERSRQFDMTAILIALREMHGELYLLTDGDSCGYRLRIPYKTDQEGVVY